MHDCVVYSNDRADLLSELMWAVYENAFIYEAPRGATDIGVTVVEHGPWDPNQCSQTLLAWLRRGWITLYLSPEYILYADPAQTDWLVRTVDDAGLVLSLADAEALLRQPERWLPGTTDGMVCLRPTTSAPTWSVDEWAEHLH
jgi:hypothetical protein